MAKRSVLVTGASGFLGINLIRYLLKRGYSLIIGLDFNPFDYPERSYIRFIRGDIRDPAAVRAAMDGSNLIVHAAAALPLYRHGEIRSTEVEGTRTLLEAAAEQAPDRFVYISSTAVYGVPDCFPISEDAPRTGVGPYGRAKIEAEDLCLEFRRRGLCVPILRPKSFVGPERLGAFELLYSWAADGRSFPLIGSGNNRYQLLDVEDLCEAIYRCLTLERKRVDTVFNIGAVEFGTLREDFQAVLDAAGAGKRIVGVPRWLAVPVLKTLEFLRLSPIYGWIYATAGKDSAVSVDRARRLLGFDPRFSNRQALLRNFAWYLGNRERIGREGRGLTHRQPWRHGILSVARRLF
jgi:nucleoside-diphosphate-sugar epimerase